MPIPLLTSGPVNINERNVQLALASVINTLYTNPALAAMQLQALLDRSSTVVIHSSAGVYFPGVIIAQTNAYNIVVIGGMQSEVQLALTALYDTLPPVSYGLFSTNPYFFAVAQFVAALMSTSGLDPTLPTLFVGHSLGGAVATVLSAEMHSANPETDVRLLTYGTPRPGDSRLRTLSASLPSVNIINVGDPIPQLPPSLADVNQFYFEVIETWGLAWGSYVDSSNRLLINSDGSTAAPSAAAITQADLVMAVEAALTSSAFPDLTPHTIAEYVRRLALPP